jgi:hypothetical protein
LLKRSKTEVEVFIVEQLLKVLGDNIPNVVPGPDPPDTIAPVTQNRGGESVRDLKGSADLAKALAEQPCEKVILYNYNYGEVLEWQRRTGWREKVAAR